MKPIQPKHHRTNCVAHNLPHAERDYRESNILTNCSLGLNCPCSIKSLKGKHFAFGICPEGSPGLGSGAVPSNRAKDRASKTLHWADSIFAIICDFFTTNSVFSSALNSAFLGSATPLST